MCMSGLWQIRAPTQLAAVPVDEDPDAPFVGNRLGFGDFGGGFSDSEDSYSPDDDEFYDISDWVPLGAGGGDAAGPGRYYQGQHIRVFGQVRDYSDDEFHDILPPAAIVEDDDDEPPSFIPPPPRRRHDVDDEMVPFDPDHWTNRFWMRMIDMCDNPGQYIGCWVVLAGFIFFVFLCVLKIYCREIRMENGIYKIQIDPIFQQSSFPADLRNFLDAVAQFKANIGRKMSVAAAHVSEIQRESGYYSSNFFVQTITLIFQYVAAFFAA